MSISGGMPRWNPKSTFRGLNDKSELNAALCLFFTAHFLRKRMRQAPALSKELEALEGLEGSRAAGSNQKSGVGQNETARGLGDRRF